MSEELKLKIENLSRIELLKRVFELKNKLQAAKELIDLLMEVREFYKSEDHPINLDDFEETCSPKCEDALKKSGHHHVDHDYIFGKKARANEDKIQELLKVVKGE